MSFRPERVCTGSSKNPTEYVREDIVQEMVAETVAEHEKKIDKLEADLKEANFKLYLIQQGLTTTCLNATGESYEAEHDQWISTTDRQPPSLEPGQYKKYLVSCNGQVFECSWLFGGWHKHHDGCSECHPDAWQYMPTPYQVKKDE